MARCPIGQERLPLGSPGAPGGTSLDEVAVSIEWAALDHLLAGISAAEGEAGWPPLALFKALLLATWHDLSDVRLAEALDDRASFRRFALHEPTPERTTLVRLRRELVRRRLDGAMFEAVTAQLDATLIASASTRHDGEARWAVHRRRKPVHGYSAQVSTDQEAWLIRRVAVTTANVHDAAELDAILPEAPGATCGDSSCAGAGSEGMVRARSGTPQVIHTGVWGSPEALARLKAHNAAVRRVRCRTENVFATMRRCCGLQRMRWPGLAEAGLQVRLAAMAYNLRRSWRLLAPKPA